MSIALLGFPAARTSTTCRSVACSFVANNITQRLFSSTADHEPHVPAQQPGSSDTDPSTDQFLSLTSRGDAANSSVADVLHGNVCNDVHAHSWTLPSLSSVTQEAFTQTLDASRMASCAMSACSTTEPNKHVFHFFQSCADGFEWVHTATGLPWWASISLTTVTLRFLLLPLSLRQARIVRSNYIVYKEAVGLTDRQLGMPVKDLHQWKPSKAASDTSTSTSTGKDTNGSSSSSSNSETHALTAAQHLHRAQSILNNFWLLRKKCGAPHPAWILVNPMVQVPVFIATGVTLRMMCNAHWPGLSNEGALWFSDLTQPALTLDTLAMPMGPAGFILPAAILAMMLTSLRLGIGASGMQRGEMPDDAIGRFLRMLPVLLYILTILNTYVKVQTPHGALLHWAASAAFTLNLQLALKQPLLRQLLHVQTAKQLQQLLREGQLGDPTAVPASGPLYSTSTIPAALVQKVQETSSADILVILGAQHSAQRRYPEAMYCLDRAIQADPTHVRAHYSRGQVFSLTQRWVQAELSFRKAAELVQPGAEKGQALYCIATAVHRQGRLKEAVEAYEQALEHWPNQPVVLFSLANALHALEDHNKALAVVEQAMQLDAQMPGSPFKPALLDLRSKLVQQARWC